MIGYMCATGSLTLEPFIYLGLYFMDASTFWSLALKTKSEYKLVNIPMLPI